MNDRHDRRHYSRRPVAAKKAVRGCHQGREEKRRHNRGPDVTQHCGASSPSRFHNDMLLAPAALHHSRDQPLFVDRRALEVRLVALARSCTVRPTAPWCRLSIVDTPASAKGQGRSEVMSLGRAGTDGRHRAKAAAYLCRSSARAGLGAWRAGNMDRWQDSPKPSMEQRWVRP